jgi:SPW repeat
MSASCWCCDVDEAGRVVQPEVLSMARTSGLKEHRTWQDWVLLGLGIVIGLSPWIAGQTADQGALICSAVIGVLVVLLAQFELVGLRRSHEFAQLACGAALMIAPLVLGYAAAATLKYWHYALGALVGLLAVLELWQDWTLSDEELAKRQS